MNDISGVIDAERLGCDRLTCIVFGEHAKGRTVPEIAEDLSMTEDSVRGIIAGVWHDDRHATTAARRIAREEW